MDNQKILQKLQRDLAVAKTRRDVAARHVARVLHEATPNVKERVRQATHEYGQALHQVAVALSRLNNYSVHGIIPVKLKPHRETHQGEHRLGT